MAKGKTTYTSNKPPIKSTIPQNKSFDFKKERITVYYFTILLGLTLTVYFPTVFNDFVNLDDPNYIAENPLVKSLAFDNIKTIFTTPFLGNYQPVTILFYAFEYKVFNLNPHAYHLVNLLLHLVNVILVFLIIDKISKKSILAFITALLFAIHPMHVESVAWIAELKDVLYAFFSLSAILLYLHYLKNKSHKGIYVLALLLFALSILAKAQAVILPMVLLLFDYFMNGKINKKSIIDKIPFFLISILFGVLAFWVQKKAGAVQDYNYFPFLTRILFSCYGLMNYFSKLLLPINLSCFYPYPETHDAINSNWVYVSPAIVLILVGVLIWAFKKSKVIVFGILFFLITIFLVLQLIPVGDAIIADRYTYIPAIGIFFIMAYYFDQLLGKYKSQRNLLIGIGSIYILVLSFMAFNRGKLWKDSITIYSDCLDNYQAAIIYNNRGAALYAKGEYQRTIDDFTQCLYLKPRYPHAYKNRAICYDKLGEKEKAMADYTSEIKLYPNDENNYINRGRMETGLNQIDAAVADYSKAISLNPKSIDAYFNRAELLNKMGKMPEAIDDLSTIIAINATHSEVYNNRGILYGQSGRTDEAISDFNAAIKLKPDNGGFYKNRSFAYKFKQNYQAAYDDVMTAKAKGEKVDDAYIQQLAALLKR